MFPGYCSCRLPNPDNPCSTLKVLQRTITTIVFYSTTVLYHGHNYPCENMQSDSTTHQCPVCLKQYKRREHLQRHRTSHTSERPHQCPSCEGRFQRADVLRRHHRTCVGRAARASVRATARRRACDRCVRQKKACNLQQPCDRCAQQAAECCYLPVNSPASLPEAAGAAGGEGAGLGLETTESPGMEADTQGNSGTVEDPVSGAAAMMMMPFRWPERSGDDVLAGPSNNDMALDDPNVLDYASPSWQDLLTMAAEGDPGRDGPKSFQFLDKITSSTGLAQSFDCGTPEQRAQVLSTIQSETGSESEASADMNFEILDSPPTDGVSLNWLDDPLSLKTHQILLLIKDVVTVKPRNSAVTLDWSPGLQQACVQFFSPANLRKFLGLYWAIWHPNVNFVHRPSFDPASAKPAVLTTMTLLGKFFLKDCDINDSYS